MNKGAIKMMVNINNMKEGYAEPYIVARLVDGTLWYYGRYSTEYEADTVAEQFDNALVMEVVENE